MPPALRRFLSSEDGATAVEYAVVLSLILVSAITAISQFGDTNGGLFENIVRDLGVFM